MNRFFAATALFLALAAAQAAAAPPAPVPAPAARAPAAAPLTEGLVRKIDKAAGKITLTHGRLPNGMPGMTMAFKVQDPARLDGLAEGQKVLFAIDASMTIVRIEAVR